MIKQRIFLTQCGLYYKFREVVLGNYLKDKMNNENY